MRGRQERVQSAHADGLQVARRSRNNATIYCSALEVAAGSALLSISRNIPVRSRGNVTLEGWRGKVRTRARASQTGCRARTALQALFRQRADLGPARGGTPCCAHLDLHRQTRVREPMRALQNHTCLHPHAAVFRNPSHNPIAIGLRPARASPLTQVLSAAWMRCPAPPRAKRGVGTSSGARQLNLCDASVGAWDFAETSANHSARSWSTPAKWLDSPAPYT